MLNRRISFIGLIVVMSVLITAGCGRKDAGESTGNPSVTTESQTDAAAEDTVTAKKAVQGELDNGSAEETPEENQEGPGETESTESEESEQKMEAFAETVQEAVADRNLEALANLLFYPCEFVTGDQDKIILEKPEDLTKQNKDMVFGDDLMVAVANVDTALLEIEKDQVVLGNENSYILYQIKEDGSMGIIKIKE